ncbi:glucans biosynthesis glucosyltransferase MdoH [Thioalkalivibrio nitratireducens]|nr:glucans biosynthesis glucosyltransferase MdoH [Thioalkalivibrio nitratireducens]
MNAEPGNVTDRAARAAGRGESMRLAAPAVRGRQILFFGVVLVTALGGTAMMAGVLSAGGFGPFEVFILGLFAITFSWIAASFWTAMAGFLLHAVGCNPLSLRRLSARTRRFADTPLRQRTAVVMPVYNEAPDRVMHGVAAMCRSLAATGCADAFDFFLLSDSNDPAIIRAEERGVARLRSRLPPSLRLQYRRRRANTGRKAGNIAEFCDRWGARYEYMVVLDADSLVEGLTLVTLVRYMDANPRTGLIQTLPLPARQETLFGRFQQFANAVHGPILAAGLAFWQADGANYWGHNAIIRIRPFMEHCGLPILPGRPPLGGEILSHDFVEAAFLRRAGWDLWLLPGLGGSHEELPGNLVDFARRDRRWIQGNLQHLRLLRVPGLQPLNRVHFLFGAVSYLSSLFWMFMLAAATGAASTGPSASIPVAEPSQPMALGLLAGTLVLLLLPKLLGVMLALVRAPAAFGGRMRLAASGLLETGYSVLIAPAMMAFHTMLIGAVLAGRNVTWSAQPREGRMVGWAEAWQRTAAPVLAGLVWGLLLAWSAPGFLWWVAPVLAGLLAAPLLVRSSGSRRAGVWLRERRLLLAPCELEPPPVIAAVDGMERRPRARLRCSGVPIRQRPWPGTQGACAGRRAVPREGGKFGAYGAQPPDTPGATRATPGMAQPFPRPAQRSAGVCGEAIG